MLEALKCSDALWTIASGEEAARTLVKGAISLGVGKGELLSHVESPVGRRFIESFVAGDNRNLDEARKRPIRKLK